MSDEQQAILKLVLDPVLKDDPYLWVKTVFPWGKENTPLHKKTLRKWQADVLQTIARHIHQNKDTPIDLYEMLQLAVASGRGIGKSALNAMVVIWFFSTRLGSTTIVAANGKPQLMSCTIPEVNKWITMAIHSDWFDATTMRITPKKWLADLVEQELQIGTAYWYIEGKLWTEENPDAFAGAHNHNGMLVVFDEASGIPTPIWQVAQGYFTEPTKDKIWLAFSNPRRPEGAFFDCFNRNSNRWKIMNIDSRDVEGIDHAVFHKIVMDNGEDSDYAKIEVRGLFPTNNCDKFIPKAAVDEAVNRALPVWNDEPLIAAVDVARKGTNETVIRFRKGRDARTIKALRYRGLDVTEVADRVMMMIADYKPDYVVIDATGVGGGVVDILKRFNYKVEAFEGGRTAYDNRKYENRRAETWAKMKQWIIDEGCLPREKELTEDVLLPGFKYHPKTNRLLIESKEDLDYSPDDGDALSMTFAVTPAPKISRYPITQQVVDFDVLNI